MVRGGVLWQKATIGVHHCAAETHPKSQVKGTEQDFTMRAGMLHN